jgi:hypothetical protein
MYYKNKEAFLNKKRKEKKRKEKKRKEKKRKEKKRKEKNYGIRYGCLVISASAHPPRG